MRCCIRTAIRTAGSFLIKYFTPTFFEVCLNTFERGFFRIRCGGFTTGMVTPNEKY
ncbi:hypothetical protein OENI_10035 [Oenococcus oeni]|nr:hypothetical protein OENI_10035 [Oenococcus oeni]SYW15680.1 hypothetical protein OENI_120023 [Oenococcus oeni]